MSLNAKIIGVLKGVFGLSASGTTITVGNGTVATGPGTALSLSATAPAQIAASQAGVGVTIAASPAVDGSSTHGAAAGGSITLTPGVGVNGGNPGNVTVSAIAPSIASAAGASYALVSVPAYTATLTGTTTITALAGLGLTIGSPTVTNTSAGLTVSTASAMVVNGPLPAGNATFTNSFALDIPTFVTNGTLAAGLRVALPSGAGTNVGLAVLTAGGGSLWNFGITGSDPLLWGTNSARPLTLTGRSGSSFAGWSNGSNGFTIDDSNNFTVGGGNAVMANMRVAGLQMGALSTATMDAGIERTAAGVVRSTNGSGSWNSNATGTGWFQNSAGVAILAANFTDAVGTLAATNLSWTVIAGRSYDINLLMKASNSTAADGFQMNFGGGTATATTFWAEATLDNGSVVAGTTTTTTLAGVLNWTTVTGTNYIRVRGRLKVNGAGTLIIKAATNTAVSGTMTLAALSGGNLDDMVAL